MYYISLVVVDGGRGEQEAACAISTGRHRITVDQDVWWSRHNDRRQRRQTTRRTAQWSARTHQRQKNFVARQLFI